TDDVRVTLSDDVSQLPDDRLGEAAQAVLPTLVVKERDVQTADGSWFYMRILPYRTSKNTVDGLVLTFLDVTKMKEAERVVEASHGLAASIVEAVREPLLVLHDQLRLVATNPAFY